MNRFAITSKGIGDALQRSASALAAAGNTIDESIGLITAANTVVQDPESVGTALKTLTLRLRGAKTELEEAGLETENMAETTASLQQKLLALTSGKVDIMIDANTFKSSTQILREMATVWEDMTDIQQAAALELMGGKRQANILSSIISNFDLVEEAITTSMESSGSAIKENEKYLDSIEGKIQQFTNSLQTMWSNTLDDKLVKDVVDLGTGLVKVVDTLGLIPSILVAIGAAKGLKLLFSSFQSAALPIKTIWQYINELTIGFKGFTLAQMKANTATATGHLINSQYSMGLIRTNLIQWLTQKSTEALEAAKYQLWLAEKGLAIGISTTADVQAAQAAVQAASISGDYAKMTTLQLLGLGFKQLMVSVWGATKAIGAFLFTNPVGWAILATSAIAGGVAIFKYFHKTTEELAEELNNLKSELQDVKSELNSLNSELETTKSRIEELVAMPSLSFAEQEELSNLRKQNDELERQIYLLEQRQKRKQKEAEKTFVDTVGSDLESHVNMLGNTTNITTKQYIKTNIGAYQVAQEKIRAAEDALIQAEKDLENAKTKKEKKQAEKEIKKAKKSYDQQKKIADTYYNYINGKIAEYSEYADGIDYDVADDETKEFLDYIYNLEDKFSIINGGDKSYAIKRIFNKEEFDDLYNSLEDLQKKLRANPEDTNIVSQIEEEINNSDIEDDLDAVGLKLQDAINYWTMLGSKEDVVLNVEVDYEEISNAIDQIQDAYSTLTDVVEQYNNTGYLTLDNLQALLSLEPEYLAVLQMENGQLSINQQAMEALLQTQLAKAEATVIDTAITQLNTLSERAKEAAIINSTNAANNAVPVLSTYASQLSTVGQEAIVAAGKVSAFNAAVDGAVAAGVSLDDVNAVIGGMNAQFAAIQSVRTNLPKNFNSIVSPKSSSSSKSEDDAFQRAMDYWENRIGAKQARYEQVQNEIDLLEKQGRMASKEHYQEQIDLEKQRLSLLEQQKVEAQRFLDTFREGSDEWWEVANTLNDIEGEMDDVTASIQDLRDAMAEVDWQIFEETHERFDNLIGQLDTIRELLSADEDTFFDDEGQWTEDGVAVLGTYIQQLAIYEDGLTRVNKELEKFQNPYAGNEADYAKMGIDSEQEYYDRLKQLTDEQYDYKKAISDTKQSVVDMYESQIDAIEEWSDKAVEAYQDYIDVVKEALDSERDLYEFKKDIQKQTKDIAALERRIASLSGSTDNSDIAERRKLEAELAEAKEGLNDSYYDHAKDSQSQALDDEASAYEESMTNYIETLREKLDQAKLNMDLFMEQVTTAVTTNAGLVLGKYAETGLAIDSALTTPWANAAAAMSKYGTETLPIMNTWTQPGGTFDIFKTTATSQLTSPWTSAANAAQNFTSSIGTVMSGVYSAIKTNVANSVAELRKVQEEIAKINSTPIKANTTPTGNGNSGGHAYATEKEPSHADIANLQRFLNVVYSANLAEDGIWGKKTEQVVKSVQSRLGLTANGKYNQATRTALIKKVDEMIAAYRKQSGSSMIGQGIARLTGAKNNLPLAFHAKGTLGTARDELAITDESWIGEEITLAAGKNGQLQYLKKGSAVMPADISANLVEWGKLNPDMMKAGVGTNFTMISNAINKPEFKLDIENFLRCDNVSQDTLPELKRFVNEQMNSLMKQMNYSLKKSGAR